MLLHNGANNDGAKLSQSQLVKINLVSVLTLHGFRREYFCSIIHELNDEFSYLKSNM